ANAPLRRDSATGRGADPTLLLLSLVLSVPPAKKGDTPQIWAERHCCRPEFMAHVCPRGARAAPPRSTPWDSPRPTPTGNAAATTDTGSMSPATPPTSTSHSSH